MSPIEFEGMTGTAAKNQPEYGNLPMHRNDTTVTSCWKMTWRERIRVLFTGRVWLQLLEYDRLITPSIVSANNPLTENPNE